MMTAAEIYALMLPPNNVNVAIYRTRGGVPRRVNTAPLLRAKVGEPTSTRPIRNDELKVLPRKRHTEMLLLLPSSRKVLVVAAVLNRPVLPNDWWDSDTDVWTRFRVHGLVT